jgi:hypothetical protein
MNRNIKTTGRIAAVLGWLWFGGIVAAVVHALLPGTVANCRMLWSYYMLASTVCFVLALAVWMVDGYIDRRKRVK